MSYMQVHHVIDETCAELGLNAAEVISAKRYRSLTFARQVIVLISRSHTHCTFQVIAESLGRTNHTTARSQLTTANDWHLDSPERKVVADVLARLQRRVNTGEFEFWRGP